MLFANDSQAKEVMVALSFWANTHINDNDRWDVKGAEDTVKRLTNVDINKLFDEYVELVFSSPIVGGSLSQKQLTNSLSLLKQIAPMTYGYHSIFKYLINKLKSMGVDVEPILVMESYVVDSLRIEIDEDIFETALLKVMLGKPL